MSIVLTPEGTPASPVEGELYYDSTADKLKVQDASGFREVVSEDSSGSIRADVINEKTSANGVSIKSGSNIGITIDSNGYVLKPNIPCFFARRQTSMSGSAHGTIVFESTASPGMNVGNHYNTNNGTFTAPVAGLYYFSWGMFKDNTSAVARADLKINGTSFIQGRMSEGDIYDNAYVGITTSLASGDSVVIDNTQGPIWSGNSLGVNQPYFCGFLIG